MKRVGMGEAGDNGLKRVKQGKRVGNGWNGSNGHNKEIKQVERVGTGGRSRREGGRGGATQTVDPAVGKRVQRRRPIQTADAAVATRKRLENGWKTGRMATTYRWLRPSWGRVGTAEFPCAPAEVDPTGRRPGRRTAAATSPGGGRPAPSCCPAMQTNKQALD